MPAPVDAIYEPVKLVLVPVAAVRDLPQDPACETRFEIDAIRELDRPCEADTSLGRSGGLAAKRHELRGERQLQSARAGREETFAHLSSRRRVRTSAT